MTRRIIASNSSISRHSLRITSIIMISLIAIPFKIITILMKTSTTCQWRTDKNTGLRTVLFIADSGRGQCATDMESRSGQMVQGMKENGAVIRHMDGASSGTLTATFSMVNGVMIRPMATASIHM